MVASIIERPSELELELEEEAMELEPFFSPRDPIARRLNAKVGTEAVRCPTATRAMVSGFSRYSNSVASLPRREQTKVRDVASLIVRSFRRGCRPFVVVRLVGHADDREVREPGIAMRLSHARALAVKRALERLINSRAITSPIAWDIRGAGASQLAVRNPTTERERLLNRRVQAFASANGPSWQARDEARTTETDPDWFRPWDRGSGCPYDYTRTQRLERDRALVELEKNERPDSDAVELGWPLEDSEEEESDGSDVNRGAKQRDLHSVATTDVLMHVFFKQLASGYTDRQFFDWIVGPIEEHSGVKGPNRFQLAGIEIKLLNNSSTAVSDFEHSLKIAGSLVVYFGHTVLTPKTTLGLALKDPAAKTPGITCTRLTSLLNAAKAKIVVLAGCSTSQCVTKITGDTVVIATDSGKDRLTNTLDWAPALKALLDRLLDGGTVGEALGAANKSFADAKTDDRFKIINGDATLKLN